MSVYSALDPILWEILRVINPLEEDWSLRFQIINDLRAVVESVESLRGATVEPYGSFVSNLFSRWGDLDLSIEIPNGPNILCAGKKHKQTLLADVLKVLRKRGGWRKLLFVAHARIPILKCERSYANISCDISINNLSGQMKSKILFWLKEADGRFHDMVLLVKEWAKAHCINDSRTGSFNSYCLSLLVIFHFQTCEPAILPPMKEIYAGNMVDDLEGVRIAAEKQIEETCAGNINKFNRSKKRNAMPLCELFVSFVEKFSNISSWAPMQGICLHTGQWEDIDSNMRWLPKTYALYVEDPFEQTANTARSVSNKQLLKISEAFQMTLQKINDNNQIQAPIIPFLVTPQVFQLLPRMMVYDPSHSYNSSMPQPQRNMPNRGPLPSNNLEDQNVKRSVPSNRYQGQNGKRTVPSNRYQGQNGRKAVPSNNHQTQNGKRVMPSSNPQGQNGKGNDIGKRAPVKPNAQRPAHVFHNQEQRVWKARSEGKRNDLVSEA